MSPDRGADALQHRAPAPAEDNDQDRFGPPGRVIPEGRHFTVRGILVGLAVGLVICFSNMYFGLQTGWVSMMTMPASLMGFGIFQALGPHLDFPFSPVENVLVQSVAGGMAIMPLGCGFVGVMPAMNYLLQSEEQGPVILSLWKLITWSLGLCYFGVVFAVPLRRQVIIREKLKFPSGFSTAILIGVLHRNARSPADPRSDPSQATTFGSLAVDSRVRLEHGDVATADEDDDENPHNSLTGVHVESRPGASHVYSWGRNIRLLSITFGVSGLYTVCTYFFPILRALPIFGTVASSTWLWDLNPSLAYVGQGIIMGPATTIHMLLGAILGWAFLSPLAKYRGWTPGPVDDWETGSKGWIVWISLGIMLADSVVSLAYLTLQPLLRHGPMLMSTARHRLAPYAFRTIFRPRSAGYMRVDVDDQDPHAIYPSLSSSAELVASPVPGANSQAGRALDEEDAPPEQLVGSRTVSIGMILSVIFCIASIRIAFGDLVPLYATVTAVAMALLLSIMGVRALGETDLNPVSGISKLAQLFFAVIIPQSNKSSVLINLVAGAVSEAGALQAGDLMQDLKTGHLLAAAPKAQFWGQVIGATVGSVVSAVIYKLYTAVYEIPGDLFQVPTAYVWIFTARLVTGKGLPPMAAEWTICAAVLFAILTVIRTRAMGMSWQSYIPGGIAVAVGMYNVPSFTLARTVGGLVSWYWRVRLGREDTPLIILASGFILGEGFLSILTLIMQSARVPHL